MPLFEIATAAQLAGSVVLALFFVLLERHDPRPYLADWMAAWIAQAVALAVFLASLRWGSTISLAAYLFLEAGHGLLLCAAARHYHGSSLRRSRYGWMLLPLGAWAAAGPVLISDPLVLHAAQYAVLAATELAAAALLWPRHEPAGMGVRLTSQVLALIGLLHALHVAAFASLFGPDAPAMLLLQAGPFVTLLLQTLLALGMVLTVMESTQRALATSNTHLQEAEHRLKILAETDPLTGCFNRRVFRELVEDPAVEAAGEGVGLGEDLQAVLGLLKVGVARRQSALRRLHHGEDHAEGEERLQEQGDEGPGLEQEHRGRIGAEQAREGGDVQRVKQADEREHLGSEAHAHPRRLVAWPEQGRRRQLGRREDGVLRRVQRQRVADEDGTGGRPRAEGQQHPSVPAAAKRASMIVARGGAEQQPVAGLQEEVRGQADRPAPAQRRQEHGESDGLGDPGGHPVREIGTGVVPLEQHEEQGEDHAASELRGGGNLEQRHGGSRPRVPLD